MPIQRKSAAGLVAEAKAKAQGIPYQRRPTIDLSTPGKKAKPKKAPANKIGDAPKQISDAKIAANKANGLKSKGPKTAEGKARVSQNALKHGLCSEKHPALPGPANSQALRNPTSA